MIWLYVALGISVALNIGLTIALLVLKKKHDKTARRLHYYNVCAGGRHVD